MGKSDESKSLKVFFGGGVVYEAIHRLGMKTSSTF